MKKITVPFKEVRDYTLEDFGGKRKNKTVCIVRYGAFGDIIQTSSLFPVFKKEGYKVCVNVSEVGAKLLKANPYIDELIIQKTNQICNTELGDYWEKMSPCFDKFVQLSESIEGNLLLSPERIVESKGQKYKIPASEGYYESQESIHKKCDVNYLEHTHKIAGVPFSHRPFYYPSDEEKEWAKKQRKKIKSKHVILVSLSGSSVHKVWPWNDAMIASILKDRKDVSIVTVGDEMCQILEVGWEKEPRVITKSGVWTIGKTMAFLDHCSVVVGPETGLLNAASMKSMRKVVFLSHSSEENLTKHWTNTASLIPKDCPCYPCHKMHFGFNTCNRDETTGGALCAANIDPRVVVSEIMRNL
jgi:ADP-heptose:LPS heptosyltransferase|tara:strand:+ start:6002 stop:7075 length:1074 start_codon:yes stop_codon:yes gene_type:complete